MAANATNKAQRLCIIQLDFRQWTGAAAFSESDFDLGKDGNLPPKEVTASLGAKKLIDPVNLRQFAIIKDSAVRVLQLNGMPFLGGYAIPIEKSNEVLRLIEGYRQAYEQEKKDFLANYDKAVNDWCQANPDFAQSIRNSKRNIDEINRRIYADYHTFKIEALNDEQSVIMEKKITGLSGDLFNEVVKKAKDLWDASIVGRDEVNARIFAPLARIRDKVNSLSFLDSKLIPIVEMIDHELRTLPIHGPYRGEYFDRIKRCVGLLADSAKLTDYINQAHANLGTVAVTSVAAQASQMDVRVASPVITTASTAPLFNGEEEVQSESLFDELDALLDAPAEDIKAPEPIKVQQPAPAPTIASSEPVVVNEVVTQPAPVATPVAYKAPAAPVVAPVKTSEPTAEDDNIDQTFDMESLIGEPTTAVFGQNPSQSGWF